MKINRLRGPDIGTLLVRALRAQAMGADVGMAVRSIGSQPWESATFAGMCHRIAIDAQPGASFDRWVAGLAMAEWRIRGHLVADLVIDRVAISGDVAALLISILTIEDN